MKGNICIPQAALTDELWENPYIGRFYFYLLRHVDNDGHWVVSFKQIQRDLGLSRQQYRTALGTLAATTLITAIATASTTTVILNVSTNKSKPKTAPITAPITASTTALAVNPDTQQQDGFERFMEYFNNGFTGTAIPKVTKLTDRRKTALRTIFKEYGKETVDTVLRKVYLSDFLSGRKTDWHATFDWIFSKTNFQKILEDNYANRPDNTQCSRSSGDDSEAASRMARIAKEVLRQSS